MSGIVGLWNRDGGPADPALVARLSATLRHRGLDGADQRVMGAAALAHQHSWVTPEETGERQPVVSRRGVALALDGRIDNRDELLGALELPRSASDATCVLAAYEMWRESFAERLNGDFAIALYDEPRKLLILARDPIGIRPLYYFAKNTLLVCASEIKALLAHPEVPRQPDDVGLSDFLLLGGRPLEGQETTCFAGISAVTPGQIITVTPDRLGKRRYWDFDLGSAQRFRTYEQYAEAFGDRFQQAVRRRARSVGPVAVSVSGGLDSSSIFCQAETLRRREQGAPILGISYTAAEGSDADERGYLRDIEREYGLSIQRIPMEPLLGLVRDADEQVSAVEAPFLDYMWGVSRAVRRAAHDGGARVILSGHWGDQMLFSYAYLVDLARRFAWSPLFKHLREYRRWLGGAEIAILKKRSLLNLVRSFVPHSIVPPLKWARRRLLRPQHLRPWFAQAFLDQGKRFANHAATGGMRFHSAQARSLYIEARSKYHVHCMEWNNKVCALAGLDAAFPFLDRDLIAFLIATPGEMHNRNGVPRGLLRDAMRGVLPEPVRSRSWKADFSLAVNQGVIRDFDHMAQALGNGALAVRRGYLRADRLASEVAELARGLHRSDCVDSWDLADMFGLEVWLQVFFSAEPREGPLVPQLEESLR